MPASYDSAALIAKLEHNAAMHRAEGVGVLGLHELGECESCFGDGLGGRSLGHGESPQCTAIGIVQSGRQPTIALHYAAR